MWEILSEIVSSELESRPHPSFAVLCPSISACVRTIQENSAYSASQIVLDSRNGNEFCILLLPIVWSAFCSRDAKNSALKLKVRTSTVTEKQSTVRRFFCLFFGPTGSLYSCEKTPSQSYVTPKSGTFLTYMYVSVCICMYLYVAARICMYWHIYHWNCLNNILVLLTHRHGYPLDVWDRQGSPG